MTGNDRISTEDQSLSLRQIVDSSPALIHTARADGYLDFFNQTWLDFAGEPLEKLLGWGWTSRIHPEDVEAFVLKMRESFARRVPFQETSRVRRADGVYRWMLHLKVPVLDKLGNLIQWNGSSIDITEAKQAEERIRQNEKELRTVIDVMPAFVGTASPDGSCDFLSENWLAYFGLKKEQGLGWGWANTIHPDDVDRVVAN